MPPSDELAQALASGYEEVVEVNQRGLIDKVRIELRATATPSSVHRWVLC